MFGDNDTLERRRLRMLAYVSGGTFAAGWFVFVDAWVVHEARGLMPPVEAAHFVPGIVATISMLMVCCAPFRAFTEDAGSLARPTVLSCARLWLFSSFLMSFASVGVSVVVAQSMAYGSESRFAYEGVRGGGSGGEPQHRWVGTAILLQTVVIFFASMLWMALRMQKAESASGL